MALKVKGQARRPQGVPKAGPKKRRAMDEQEAICRAIEENTRKINSATRKSSRVRKYSYKERPSNNGKEREPWLYVVPREPHGLSLEAQWMEFRVSGWSPLDWWQLFTRDTSLWEFIIEEAKEEVANG